MHLVSGFIAALGVAAVATALTVALFSAAISSTALIVAGAGVTAAVLGTVGLFKCQPTMKFTPPQAPGSGPDSPAAPVPAGVY